MDSVSQYSNNLRRPAAILFAAQIVIIFVVSVVSLVNLTLEIGNQNLWTVLLTSCLGYVMPNPRLKTNKSNEDHKIVLNNKNPSNV